jgi:pimeloyl-ACP methyl ester carboxylesterase
LQIGFWPYIPFLKEIIAQDPDVGILAIELLPVSMRITDPLLSRSRNCLAITRIINSLNIPAFVLVSHSYGTVVTTHMLHSPELAPRISSTVFIDPIPFLLHLPHVAFNFVYRKPRLAKEWLIWYFASRDPDISRALSRHFFWAENVMWKDELEGKRTAVVLSGADQIVHAREVRRYLTGEDEPKAHWENDDLEVLFFPELDHAAVFNTKERRKPILSVIRRYVALA